MEVDNINLSEINSFHINEIRRTAVIDLNKKRKLQAEQLGLPIAKLKCSDGSFPSKYLSRLDEPEEVDWHTNIIEAGATNCGFEYESAKDNNSFADDSDYSMSIHGESKFQAENGKSWPCNGPSSSSFNWGPSSLKDQYSCLDSAAATEGNSGKEQYTLISEEHRQTNHVGRLHTAENLVEHLTECGSNAEYNCLGYGHDNIEQFIEKESEEILDFSEENPNSYVLLSGRWSVNRETQRVQRRPTIDQEFEQYFSTLML